MSLRYHLSAFRQTQASGGIADFGSTGLLGLQLGSNILGFTANGSFLSNGSTSVFDPIGRGPAVGVPEPTGIGLVSSALLALTVARRRSRASQSKEGLARLFKRS